MPLPPPRPRDAGDAVSPLSRLKPPPTRAQQVAAAAACDVAAQYRDRLRGMVDDEQIERAGAVIERARAGWRAAGNRSVGDADRWDADRARHRTDLHLQLREAIPELGKVRAVQAKATRVLAERTHVTLPVFEPVIAPADPVPTLYRPPFAQDRLGTLDDRGHSMDVVDRSFVRREIGHLVVDADLAARPGSTWGFNELFGLLPIDHGCVSAACGTAFTMPQDGRVQVTAALRNLYSRTTMSVTDRWGFSSGSLTVEGTVFIAVLRLDGGEVLHSVLTSRTLTSDGDDKSALLPDIEQQVFRLLANTESRFSAGETLFVLAGVYAAAGSVLNDMVADVRTLMWWVLEELGIAVVQ